MEMDIEHRGKVQRGRSKQRRKKNNCTDHGLKGFCERELSKMYLSGPRKKHWLSGRECLQNAEAHAIIICGAPAPSPSPRQSQVDQNFES